MERLKELFSKYVLHIFLVLILVALVLLLLPEKKEEKLETSILTLTLKGNTTVSIQKGEHYVEAGYVAYDTKDGDLTNMVVVEGTVDSTTVGTYEIKYSVTNSRGQLSQAMRTINVVADLSNINIEFDYEPKDLTNKDVNINFKISGEGYEFMIDPDGTLYKETSVTYNVSSNDEYVFSIKMKDGNIVEKIVTIKNIDKKKPIGSCKNIINDEKTEITVSASDESGIANYSYNLNGKKYDSESNNYIVKEAIRNVTVTIYDKASNYEIINCIAVDNSWPTKTGNLLSASTPKNYIESNYDGLEYILYYPDNLDLSKKNPLVLFLHGYGPSSAKAVANTTFGKNMKEGRFQGAIFLAPNCYVDGKASWNRCSKKVMNLIDNVVSKYNVDPNRISITGHSDGGAGTYLMIYYYPDKFSAAAVVAGAPSTYSLDSLKKLKVAVFYGSRDHNFQNGTNATKALINKGVNLKLYVEDGITHDQIPAVAYEQYNVIEWLTAQSK